MVFKLFKKISDSCKNAMGSDQGFVFRTKERFNIIWGSSFNLIESIKNELHQVRARFANLLDSNYKLGLYHLERGNLKDAIFRFHFIKRFWPNHYDSYYQLAYCLILSKKYAKAQLVLKELISKSPEYNSRATELMQKADKAGAN